MAHTDNKLTGDKCDKSFFKQVRERASKTTVSRWIRFGLVSALFIAWVAWLGSWWVLIFLPLLFDIYITGFIPFTWWKNAKNPVVRTVMSWVDAIVYALILVYFVFSFVGQNYAIPSSSLEKTLLVGDYLWVNKMAYGPRVPMTPVHFPLVQNRMPIIDTKSYLDNPQWKYRRLKGYRDIERGDIVVFNFPQGDTVATRYMESPQTYYDLVKQFGAQSIRNNPDRFGEVIHVPVDRRQNYVKRCVGLPGETIAIQNDTVLIDGKPISQPENVQFNYFYQLRGGGMTDKEWDELGIAPDDRYAMQVDAVSAVANGFYVEPDGRVPAVYVSPLTQSMADKLKARPDLVKIAKASPYPAKMYPEGDDNGWTVADFGPLWIPKKGASIPLNERTWPYYERVIRNYEGHHDAYLKNGTVYVDGKPAEKYTFDMDYYFMMGDNRDNSLDSRFWGFVPEDHIVGTPWRVLVSFDKDRSWLNGHIRWNRIFKKANPDSIK
ncbi:signal peptidase I [uncultured Muribaculum sp.]|uniref:signal peptidase I n=1 Tax=uncultured Muribaculum sp. TaxID=1918613 RepID=UPI0026DF3725|nr:signal peptidase I [uncultured Muribaculum sp.]